MRDRSDLPGRPPLTPCVVTLIVSCVVTYGVAELLGSTSVLNLHFALWPTRGAASRFEIWQLVTYGFLHGNPLHLGFNMLALWMFGHVLEHDWGSLRLALYYIGCVIAAGATHLAFAAAGFGGGIVVGASGGVFGLLLAIAVHYPRATVIPLLPPLPMRPTTLAILYGAAALFLGLTGKAPVVAHFAHLGGMLGGLLLVVLFPRQFGRST